MHLPVLILTFKEEIHIEYCITSAQVVTDRIVVIDSYSINQTLNLSEIVNFT